MLRFSIFVISALAASAMSSTAYAHAHLKGSVPAENASVATPSEIDLTFSEELNLKFSGIKLTGADKKEIKFREGMLMETRSLWCLYPTNCSRVCAEQRRKRRAA